MGANAQTSVPLFVANSVLTAAQQNISAATGVPVFATTVTRDAAFGGSNKVLAEGQLAYIEASDVVQYYTGAAWATLAPTASKVAQVLSTTLQTTFTSSATSFTTITGLSQAITPTLNTSTVLVMAQVVGQQETGVNQAALRLVRGSTAIDVGAAAGSRTLASQQIRGFTADYPSINTFIYLDSPATTSSTTYAVQGIALTAGNWYINRSVTDSDSSGYVRTASTITVMEILA